MKSGPAGAVSLRHFRDLLRELVVRDFKLRYKRSMIGIAWSLLVPLAQFVVLYFVFRLVLPLNVENYTSFLFTGLLPWTWFQTSLLSASGSIVENRDLVRQVGFPSTVLPIVSVTSQMIHFFLALPILFFFLVADGWRPSIVLAALPFLLLIQFLFTTGLGYLAAASYVRFRDTQYLLGIALFLAFYLTPVFYDQRIVPAAYQLIYTLNPMAQLLAAYRSVLIEGVLPKGISLLALSGASVAAALVGYYAFRAAQRTFVEEI